MTFKIPYTFSDLEIAKRKSKSFLKFTSPKKTKLDNYLKDCGTKVTRRQYLSISYRTFFINLLVVAVLATSLLGFFRQGAFFLYGAGIAILISGFILMIQTNYPRTFANQKAKNIEKNLISVLQDMLVQLNSGVPIFDILLNIADSDYGQASEEFKKITKEISAGVPQIDALERYGELTNSKYFKRILWQLSNGMRAGSDMAIIIKEGIKSLSDEQAIQIQNYGGQLNPLIMFYMLMAVIIPALGVTFLIIISSLIGVEEKIIKFIFFGIFGAVTFMQVMFVGIIKSRRPSLL